MKPMNTEKFEMVAKTFAELEDVLAEELTNLGADEIEIGRRMVSFKGDLELMYKANLHCRTAVRILKPIAKFTANNTDQVYEQIKKIRWENYIQADQTFSIDATVYSDDFSHSKFLTYRAKDAIVDYFMEQFNRRPSVRVTNADLMINLHVSHDQVTISLDSSGESLHKRGWRTDQTEAPLNEVLAAGMILKTGWRGNSDFLDPMCGSGTLLIEAAMIALNIPPGIYRKEFAFERWKDYDEELFDRLYNDETYERDFDFKIYGSDMSPRAIAIAEENIKSAGVGKCIELSIKPLQEYTEIPGTGKCVIVTNPPYGERISSKDLLGLYENIGERLKHVFIGCETWILSYRYECFEKIGLRPSAKIKLMNGGLDCEFRKFEIFEGKRKEFKTKLAESGEEAVVEEATPITFKRRDDNEIRKEFAKNASAPRSEFRKERGERSFGDRKERSFGGDRKFGDRKERSFDGEKKFGDRKPRFDRSERGERSFGDRKERSFGGDRKFGDRKERSFGGDRKFGDRKPGFDRSERGERSFGDRKERSFGGDRKFGDRKERSFGGDRKFGDRKSGFDRSERGDRKFGDRKERSFGGDRKFGDRKPGFDRSERGERSFGGDRKPAGTRDAGGKRQRISNPADRFKK